MKTQHIFPRLRAFALHLSASILVVGTAIVLMDWAWYPGPLAKLQGWLQLLWVVLGVDLVLGPTLTFLVYAPGKKSLRFDLTVIVLIQLSAFAYGIYTSAIGRPAYLVFLKDRFEVVAASEYPEEEIRAAKDNPFIKFPWLGPKIVTAEQPTDRGEKNRMVFSALQGGGIKIALRHYLPYETAAKGAAASGKSLTDIQSLAPQQAKTVAEWLKSVGKAPDSAVFVPVKARLGYGLAMLDAKTGAILGLKAIDPAWY